MFPSRRARLCSVNGLVERWEWLDQRAELLGGLRHGADEAPVTARRSRLNRRTVMLTFMSMGWARAGVLASMVPGNGQPSHD